MAGAKIGSLNVDLTLETARFQTGLRNAQGSTAAAQKSFEQLGSRMENLGFKAGSLGKSIASAGLAIAGSAVVAKLGDLVKSGLDYASSLGETAQQLGVTTRTLQEFRYAATQVGLSQDEMDGSLAKLTRTMGEAATGSKAPLAAFEKLGINIKTFVASGKDAGALIPLIAEGLKGVATPAERAALLVDLFGRAGQKLAPLLADGAKGVNDLRKAAQDLGVVMSDAMIKKADDAADKISSLETVMKARLAVTVANNSDKILKLAEAFGKLATESIKAFDAITKFLDSPAGKRLFQASSLAQFTSPLSLAGDAYSAANRLLGNTGSGGGRPTATRPAPAQGTGGWDFRTMNLDAAGKFRRQQLAGAGALSPIDGWLPGLADVQTRLAAIGGQLTGVSNKAMLVGQSFDQAFGKFTKGINDDDRATEAMLAIDLAKQFKVEFKTGAQEAMQAAADTLARQQERFRDVFSHSFSDGIMAALDGDLKGFFRGWLRDIAANALTSAFGNLADSIFAKKSGGGGLLGSLLGIGVSAISGGKAASKLKGFAQGGSFTVGGEAGVDKNLVAFMGTKGERVSIFPSGMPSMPVMGELGATPRMDMRDLEPRRQTTINMHNDFRGADAHAVAGISAKLDHMQRTLKGEIVGTVGDAIDRRVLRFGR